jgi:hypothetical protein
MHRAVLILFMACSSSGPERLDARIDAVADADTDAGADVDAGTCARGIACAACLSSQPNGSPCRIRWDECQENTTCVDALPVLYDCLCTVPSQDDRWTCAGNFGTESDKAFNLAYCVGVDACYSLCIQ